MAELTYAQREARRKLLSQAAQIVPVKTITPTPVNTPVKAKAVKSQKKDNQSIPTYQPTDKVKPQGKIEINEMLQSNKKGNEVLQMPKNRKLRKEFRPPARIPHNKPLLDVGRKPTPKQIAFALLKANSTLTDHQISKIVGVSSSYPSNMGGATDNVMDKLREMAPDSLASLRKLVTGEYVGQMDSIKGSDVLGAIDKVLARVAPVIHAAPTTQGNTFTQIIINNLPGQSDKLPVIDIG